MRGCGLENVCLELLCLKPALKTTFCSGRLLDQRLVQGEGPEGALSGEGGRGCTAWLGLGGTGKLTPGAPALPASSCLVPALSPKIAALRPAWGEGVLGPPSPVRTADDRLGLVKCLEARLLVPFPVLGSCCHRLVSSGAWGPGGGSEVWGHWVGAPSSNLCL